MPTSTPSEDLNQKPEPTPPGALANPVFDDSNLKSIAQRFKELTTDTAKAPPPPNPDPSKLAPAAKPPEQKQGEPQPSSESPKPDPNPTPLAKGDTNPRRAQFLALEQARDEFKKQAEAAKAEQEKAAKALAELQAELEQLKKLIPSEPTELQKQLAEREKFAEENKQLLEQLETLNLERSPRFQNWWKTETGKHIAIALRQLPAEQQDKAKKLLSENPSALLDELPEELSKAKVTLIAGAVENLERLRLEREEALAKGSERWKELQEHEKAEMTKAESARKVKMQTLAEKALSRAKVLDAFKPIDGNAEHNSKIAEREAFVRAMVSGQIDEETALSVPGAVVQFLHLKDSVIPSLEKRIQEQDALIKQLQGASPDMRGGHAPAPSATKDLPPGGEFAARVAGLMRGK